MSTIGLKAIGAFSGAPVSHAVTSQSDPVGKVLELIDQQICVAGQEPMVLEKIILETYISSFV